MQQCWQQLEIPVMHQYAVHDKLVPIAVTSDIKREFPDHHVDCFVNSAHLPFFDEPEHWVASVAGFLLSEQAKNRIRRSDIQVSFSKAASQYDANARIQQHIGYELIARLPDFKVKTAVDLGSGTGYFLPVLTQRYPKADWIALDVAAGMLCLSQAQHANVAHVMADVESLPIAEASIDLAFSNLSFQWTADIASTLQQVFAILRPGGHCVLSTLVDGSLIELASAWNTIDRSRHVNRFESAEFVKSRCLAAGFSLIAVDVVKEVDWRESLMDVLHSLKAIGAHNMQRDRVRGLAGKRVLRELEQVYETHRNKEYGLPLSYQVMYLILQKPAI
jgi:malonyl-CoA O-methyltransferase